MHGLPLCLTLGGAATEFFGLGVVFVELAIVRSLEFERLTPWRGWWIKLRGPQRVALQGTINASFNATGKLSVGDGKARPGTLSPDDDAEARISRLERYVDALDRDLSVTNAAIVENTTDALRKATENDQVLQDRFDQKDARRKEHLKWSLRRQLVGAVLVLVGLTVGTVGNVM
ncbi:MAG TPA: hypothetical protein VGM91_05835 [Conexibacter sp.]|jgi:hypothetical protein